MRHISRLCLFILAVFWLPAFASPADALKTLSQIAPITQWDTKSVIEVDIDCDNQKDYIFLSQVTGQADGKVTVGMVLGKHRNKAYFSKISMTNNKKEACTGTANILVESLDYEPKFTTAKSVEGFKRSQCQSFRLESDKCEPYHFYWNTTQDRPAWWRWSK